MFWEQAQTQTAENDCLPCTYIISSSLTVTTELPGNLQVEKLRLSEGEVARPKPQDSSGVQLGLER